MRAVYRWQAQGVLRLETYVSINDDLSDYEVVLASYFCEQFNVAAAFTGEKPGWLAAEPCRGLWKIFPRDGQAGAVIEDGRWRYAPSPVSWVVRPALLEPIGMRRAESSGLTARRFTI